MNLNYLCVRELYGATWVMHWYFYWLNKKIKIKSAKKIKKARWEINEQYPNIKIKDQRTLKVAKVKKKIVQAKFRAQNLRFFIKIRENTALTTHPSDEKGAKMMRAFGGRFCHKKERSKCYISTFPTHNFDFKSARNTCFCQMSLSICIFYVLLWLLFKIKFLTLPRKFLICLT